MIRKDSLFEKAPPRPQLYHVQSVSMMDYTFCIPLPFPSLSVPGFKRRLRELVVRVVSHKGCYSNDLSVIRVVGHKVCGV